MSRGLAPTPLLERTGDFYPPFWSQLRPRPPQVDGSLLEPRMAVPPRSARPSTLSLPRSRFFTGFTAWPGTRPQVLRPLFSFAKTSLHSDILLTPLEQYWDHEPWDPAWEAKKENKAMWRGSTTGVWFDRTTWWRSSQRVRLYFTSKDRTGSRLVRFDGVGEESGMGVESIVERNVSTSVLVDRYLDFGFSGKAGQCTEEDGSCDAVKELIEFMPTLGWNQANEYKYLLDLDGNAWSGRFHRLLSSNSVVLKSTIFPEWCALSFYHHSTTSLTPLAAGIRAGSNHGCSASSRCLSRAFLANTSYSYVPLKVDYSDLFDIMAFFSGDLKGRNGHEEMAKKIATQGQEYAAKHWRYPDLEACETLAGVRVGVRLIHACRAQISFALRWSGRG